MELKKNNVKRWEPDFILKEKRINKLMDEITVILGKIRDARK